MPPLSRGRFLSSTSSSDDGIDGFRIETDGRAIYADNSATIKNNVLIGSQPAAESFQSGVFSGTTRSLVILDNYIEGFDRGITLDGGPGSIASTIEGNVITGVGTGISTHGSLFESTGHEIRGNLIDDVSGSAIVMAGRTVSSSVEGSTFTIEGNTISHNNNGIVAGWGTTHSAEDLVVTGNNIYGNASVGITNIGPGDAFDATCNFWGDPTGPSGDGSGSGDAVQGEVDYVPWLIDEAPGGECVGGEIPLSKDDCKSGAWQDFGFKNQGQCIQFVNTGKDSR